MASLLDRMNIGGSGPVRNKAGNSGRTSTPYNRPAKGDVDSAWKHDLFDDSLGARMGVTNLAQKALASINPASRLSIKGAGMVTSGNVVEVSGLVEGTTREDVKAIFSQCGDVLDCAYVSKRGEKLKMRVTFKESSSAEKAKKMFDKKVADGNVLSVEVVGTSTARSTLGGRLGADGLGLVREEGSVDVLMSNSNSGGSKLRSDALLNSERAVVMVAPPGADPRDYVQGAPRGRGNRGGRGRGRIGGGGRGAGRGNRGGLAGRMDVD